MKLVARIVGEKAELVANLLAEGVRAKLVRRATIVELEPETISCRPRKFALPPALGEFEYALHIDIAESGGGMTNRGYSTVVADDEGRPLKPYYVPKGYSNSDHAYFSHPGPLTVVHGSKSEGHVEIVRLSVKVEDGVATIVEERIWSGESDSRPELFDKYAAACDAAMGKAKCYHCRHVHFAVGV
jgi:hypothetical protein